MPLTLNHRYAKLPAILHRKIVLEAGANQSLIISNNKLAAALRLPDNWQEVLFDLNGKQALAMAYAGHQFGGFNPSLGDGRAALLAEVIDAQGQHHDIHLKGSGPTPFSRNGDGRATLSAMLREYILSEAFAGLGIPSTRSLAVLATGEPVYREKKEQGAVLYRTAKSHVRVGTFQYLSVRQDVDALHALADYEIAHNFPNLEAGPRKYELFLEAAISRQATLIAQWMCVGFIHGVMNTDNMQLAGETIDFGPCAFMDVFHPQKVFSSIDQSGRYAWDKQPVIALWNLTRFAEAILPLINEDREQAIKSAQAKLEKFMPQFEAAFETRFLAKLGIFERHEFESKESDGDLIAATLQLMTDNQLDFTNFFVNLQSGNTANLDQAWLNQWLNRLEAQPQSRAESVARMRGSNPIIIARNHRVAEALVAAEKGDISVVTHLVAALQNPFDQTHLNSDLTVPPTEQQEVRQTFCGT